MFIKAVIYKSLVKRIIPVPYEQPLGMKRDWTDGTNACMQESTVCVYPSCSNSYFQIPEWILSKILCFKHFIS